MVATHLRWVGAGGVILIGDSIFEMLHPARFSVRVTNAGFGGAQAGDIETSMASQVVAAALAKNPPRLAIIQAGTNNCHPDRSIDAGVRGVVAIVNQMRRLGSEVVILAVPPIDPNKTALRSPAMAVQLNELLAAEALKLGVAFRDPYQNFRGERLNEATTDGIHLSDAMMSCLESTINALAAGELKAA